MKHLGDITKIDGHKVPLVDIITGGSPCQDLSVAGKRAGLAGERSGLFMEQIRIIKEMRDESTKQLRLRGADVDIRYIQPRYMVWENVPGAFSSNKGEDFRAVLEETAKVCDKDAVIPRPENGKWSPSGCIMGDGWSIAWRVHDAQFWGVPQRRKRIALVTDFGGQSAPQILFESEGLSGDSETSREEGQGTSSDSERGIDPSSYTLKIRGGVEVDSHGKKAGKGPLIQTELSGTLGVSQDQTLITRVVSVDEKMGQTYIGEEIGNTLGARDYKQPQAVVYGLCSDGSNAMKSSNPHSGIYEAETTRTLDNNGGNPACNQGGMIVLEGNGSRPSHKGDGYAESETMYTLNSTENHAVAYDGCNITCPTNASNPQKGDPCHTLHDDSRNYVVIENHANDSRCKIREDGVFQTLSSRMGTGGNNEPMVMEQKTYQKVCGTVDCGIAKGTGNQLANQDMFVANTSVVRRLTPLECERLQGYPDYWTDIGEWTDSKGKKHKDADSPRYKALGNSIALPYWAWMAKRMVKHLGKDHPTMASLFDGIGGFPLVYSRAGCEPIWASEIEEFPIAVTKIRFPEEKSSDS